MTLRLSPSTPRFMLAICPLMSAARLSAFIVSKKGRMSANSFPPYRAAEPLLPSVVEMIRATCWSAASPSRLP